MKYSVKTLREAGKKWAVTAPSAYRIGHVCLLGSGDTKVAAMEDAFGPKPWGNSTKKAARNADCVEVTAEELADMEGGQ